MLLLLYFYRMNLFASCILFVYVRMMCARVIEVKSTLTSWKAVTFYPGASRAAGDAGRFSVLGKRGLWSEGSLVLDTLYLRR